MAIREINIDDLQVGMYVTKLDVSWLDSPFLVHQLRIKSLQDIAKLRAANVKRVVIDPSKSVAQNDDIDLTDTVRATELEPDAISAIQEVAFVQTKLQASKESKIEQNAEIPLLAKELSDANRIATTAKQTLQRVMDDALNGKAIDKIAVTNIITDTLASLGRNDQALLTLMHIQRQGGTRQVTHAFNVMCLAMAVGHQRGLTGKYLEYLGLAALLHDVGWVQLPASLFGKGRPYTEKECKLVDQHIRFSLSILRKSPDLPGEVSTLVRTHHMHLEAKKSFENSRSEDWTTAWQILTVVDAYDSLLHGLLEHPAMLPTAALRMLFVQARAGHFDVDVVGMLVNVLGIYPLTSIVELNTGEIGIVVELRRPHLLQPVVKIC